MTRRARLPPGAFAAQRRGGIHTPFSQHSTSVRRRRARVSSFLALVTQKVVTRRYEGGCASKNLSACGLARRIFSDAESSARGADSNEYGAGPLEGGQAWGFHPASLG